MKKILMILSLSLVSVKALAFSPGTFWMAIPLFESVYKYDCFGDPEPDECWFKKYAGVTVSTNGRLSGWEVNTKKAFHQFVDTMSCSVVKRCAYGCHLGYRPGGTGHVLDTDMKYCAFKRCKNTSDSFGKACYKEFRETAVSTGWTSRVAAEYHKYEVKRYKKELYELAKKEMTPVSPELREAATELLAELGSCLKGTKDKAGVKACYLDYKEAILSLLH